MKSIIIKILQLLFSSPHFAIKFKDAALSNPAEHLVRTVSYIEKRDLGLFGTTILDIGAANGNTCVYFSQLFPEHTVIGFEPVTKSFKKAQKITARFKNIQLRHMALAEKEGDGHVHITADSLASSIIPLNKAETDKIDPRQADKLKQVEIQEVMISTIDLQYTDAQPVLLMKLDTQGTELSILKGGVNTLKLTKLVLVEMNNHELYKGACQYYEVDEFLRSQNFKLRDMIVTYRSNGEVPEYDALYENISR
jgi:FkbM family methyltransferase